MYKIKLIDPFFSEILTVELPTIPSINESIAIWQDGALVEFDVKAATHYTDKNNRYAYTELFVEMGAK